MEDKRRRGFFGLLRADAYYKNMAEVPWECYASKGVKLVLVDIDNTLAVHGLSDSTDYAKNQIDRIKAADLKPVLLSNALAERAQAFADSFDMDVIGQANKPSTAGIDQARERYSLEHQEIVLIGDQLFTDIMAGRRGNILTMRVDPLHNKEPWYILLKRMGERLLRRPLGYDKHYDEICRPGDPLMKESET